MSKQAKGSEHSCGAVDERATADCSLQCDTSVGQGGQHDNVCVTHLEADDVCVSACLPWCVSVSTKVDNDRNGVSCDSGPSKCDVLADGGHPLLAKAWGALRELCQGMWIVHLRVERERSGRSLADWQRVLSL